MGSTEVTQVFAAADIVGESIVWDERNAELFWVDLVGKRLHRMHPESGRHAVFSADQFVTSVGLCADDSGRLIVGLERDVALWSWGEDFKIVATPEPDLADNRLNEGKVGPDGAYWVATMRTNLHPDGQPKPMNTPAGHLYRIAADSTCVTATPEIFTLPNTLAWTDDRRLIIADTAANTIYQYTLGADGLPQGERRTFALPFERGFPDGSCMDDEGYLWNCRVDGGYAVARYAPDGTLDRVVELPCAWPTSCCFGGPNLDRLYITSARFTMSEDHLAQNPQEGALFSVDVGVKGRLEHRFGG
ncbi:SMP-30/gluconolactonase/LRE family protein [Devosia epidermidihirudinis]|nr:SMP-30/gluconolactonase/LRE family protein [Devosia epidermidihirudinis]